MSPAFLAPPPARRWSWDRVSHVRRTPLRHALHPPPLPVARRPRRPAPAGLAAAAPGPLRPPRPPRRRRGGGIRGDLTRFLAGRGIRLAPRTGSSCWPTRGCSGTSSTRCRSSGAPAPTATLRAVVFEVHNTYGERHAYMSPSGALLDAVRRFADGERLIGPPAPELFEAAAEQVEPDDLPLMALLMDGASPVDIAQALGRTEDEVVWRSRRVVGLLQGAPRLARSPDGASAPSS